MSAAGKSPYGYRYIGAKRRAKEHPRFVSGRGRFVADIALPGMKHVALVASPHASARIVSIKTETAIAAPGVLCVLTGEEFCANTDSLAVGVDAPRVTRWALAKDVVRYAGEWVAAVVADSRALAEDAAELVEVEYEPLPHVIDPEKSLAPGAPLVHQAHGSNVLYHRKFVWGPVEEAFANAEHKIAFRAVWGRSATVPIETFGVAAQWDAGTQILDVWASIQMPKYPDQTARALRLPGNAVRVHYDVDVGGSYGAKRGLKHTVLAGYLARKLGVPVRLIEDRLENLRGGDTQGPDRIFDMQVAFDREGAIRALKIRALDDVGAYAGRSPLQLGKPVTAICGPYRIEAIEYEPTSVMTHKTPQEAVRGFGQSPTNFAIERAIDRVARHLGMDRIELRKKNLIRKDQFPYTIPSGSAYDSGDYHAVLDKTLPVGSRMAIMLGGAAAGAAKKIRETLIAIAAHNFECSPEDLEYRDGNVSLKGAPEKKLTWDQLVEIAHRKFHKLPTGLEPGLQAKFVWEVPTGGGLPTAEGRIQIYPCYAFEAHVVYVEVDPDTAKPSIRKYVCGHDCGTMINPDIVHGMTFGGIAHGIGAALYEKFAYTEDGQLAAGTFMDYLIPSAMEVPALAIVDHCTPSPLTTFGQKGSGEAGYLGAPAAIASAVNDALEPLGASIDSLPMSHLAIWKAIDAARKRHPERSEGSLPAHGVALGDPSLRSG